MKSILIVDDEQPFLLSLQEGLSDQPGYRIETALNGQEALNILSKHKIDLLVTDLKMPVMDGFSLLAHMSGNYPGIPVIVMTAFGTQEIEERFKKIENFHYLEKPLDLDILAETINQALDCGDRSFIRGINLATFLQLIQLEKKTCTLKIKSQSEIGYLYIEKGELIAAETDNLVDEEAACQVVCWQDPEIEMESVCRKKNKGIKTSIERLLLEAFRLEDERKETERLGSPSPPDALAETQQPKTGSEADQKLKESSEIFYDHNVINKLTEEASGSGLIQAERLSEFLHQSVSVLDFGIYAEDDLLFAKKSKQTTMVQLCPSVYFAACRKLAELLEQGILKYLTIRHGQGPRMLMFLVGELQAVVALRPGIRSGEFIAQVAELAHAESGY